MLSPARLASQYLAQKRATQNELDWGVQQLEAAANLVNEVATAWSAPRQGDHDGTEPLTEIYPETAAALKDLEKFETGLRDQATKVKLLVVQTRQAGTGIALDAKTKRRVNGELVRVGLGGKRSFAKAQNGYSVATEILGNFDLQLDDVINSFEFTKPEGRFTARLALTNPEDPFAPMPVRNSMLVFSFYQRETGNFECLAYIS